MGKVFAMQARAAADPARFCLWSQTDGMPTLSDKPRDALPHEVQAYLRWLAHKRGIHLPREAVFSGSGVTVGDVQVLEMPGYGQDTAVVMETLDDAGEVVRSSRIGVDAKGKLGLKADAVREACALPKVRKPRAMKAVAAAAPVVAAEPAAVAASEPVEAHAAPSGHVEALEARIAALEAVVARLARGAAGKRVRSEAERRAILRAWRYRCDMRARADLDRRALEAANGAYRGALDVVAHRTAERDEARQTLAIMREVQADASAAADALERRAARMSHAARRYRMQARRLGADLRGSQAEARALSRRLADTSPSKIRARVPSAPIPAMLCPDSSAVAALAR